MPGDRRPGRGARCTRRNWSGRATTNFPDADTAFVYIAGKAGGPALFFVVNLALLVASVGSGAGSHLAAGRLLYGMGRDNAIPRVFLASSIRARTSRPTAFSSSVVSRWRARSF